MPRALAACCGAALLLRNASGRGVIWGVTALPRNNRPGGGGAGDASSGHQPPGRGSVALRDAFPCDSSSDAPPPVSAATENEASVPASAEAAPPDCLSTNSFAAQNGINVANSPAEKANYSSGTSNATPDSSLNVRGGASVEAGAAMNDDALDLMVDQLISGLDEDAGELMDETEEDVESADEETEEEEEEEEEEQEEASEENEVEEESEADEENEEDATTDAESPQETIHGESPTPEQPTRDSPGRPLSPASISIAAATTPTNAYYRFLVRRGPKGHFLAAFTLIAVQWVYVYTPIVHRTAASILLKLRIYDPNLLYERDRERQRRAKYGPPKKKGLASKLFGSSKKDAAQREKERVKQKDAEAASKLKQLYRTMKVGGGVGMLSEVKYRYLGPAFRRRHGLGNEYRVEKPRTRATRGRFLGEVVEGSVGAPGADGEVNADDIVFSDGELDDVDGLDDADAGEMGEAAQRGTKGQTKRRGKRKKINDWVVGAFASHRRPSRAKASTAATDTSGGGTDRPPSSLWKTVERGAILEAAWASRAAEQLATTTKGRKRGDGDRDARADAATSNEEPTFDAAAPAGSGSGYGASKMFQSVMSRVGTNGRIFGAYPNDAPPIDECANERGVLGLARRYGYGEWRTERARRPRVVVAQSDDEEMDELGGWGGDFDDVAEPDVPSSPTLGRKSRRRKRPSDSSPGKKRKRRSRSKMGASK
ncbi:hypothetical protein ACHAXT_010976 [Thalassiosira profunda]